MSNVLGKIALVLGGFLLLMAVFAKFYMYDRLAVAPLNNTSTSISQTPPGDDAEYLDIANGPVVQNGPLKSTRIVEGDVDKSKQASEDLDRDIAVWTTYSCTAPPTFDCGSGQVPLSGRVDVVAFDQHTGETVEWEGTSSESGGDLPESPFDFEGLYFKFPFDTQKKDYEFWDGSLNRAEPARFVGESEIDGLTVYDFEQVIEPTLVGQIDVPGSLVGSDEDTVTADRFYSNTRTFRVEPTTGVIIVGGEDQDSYLEVGDERVLTATDAVLQYTDENTQDTIDEYKPKARLLGLVDSALPLWGTIVGVVLIGVGFVLGRRDGADTSGGDHTA